ncbi:hypothetical protein [Streptomyces carpinensis]|uniref:hypothetical protein n=1 Tax=Streptomyces carpinensis TaxID=66369 RepID=UPI001180AB2D
MAGPIARWGAALGLGAVWWWAVLRLVLSSDAGVLEGAVAAGGWGLSLLPVHCVPKGGSTDTPEADGRPGPPSDQVPGPSDQAPEPFDQVLGPNPVDSAGSSFAESGGWPFGHDGETPSAGGGWPFGTPAEPPP